ncbi:alpha-N-arabinofuranosidase [bacterium]|nr:alpha-N-arabinofuranosidase [bacterium]
MLCVRSFCVVAGLNVAFLAGAPSRVADSVPENVLVVHCDQGKDLISRNIYGHFAEHLGDCIYGGVWVGEDSPIPNTRGIRKDVVEALRRLHVPVLRWPGGCYADEYHWREGIGARDQRPATVNTHWGMVVESNHFGTHEFLDFCQQIGAEAYISGNLGSGTVQELSQWVEYVNYSGESALAELRRKNGRREPWGVTYWGVGNESWGCGGNMTAEYYADQYRRYATYLRDYPGMRITRIACGASDADYRWTEVLMREAGRSMQGLSLHHYTWARGKTADDFDEAGWFSIMKNARLMDELITKHSEIMDKYDPRGRVGLVVDEWGTWYDVDAGTNPSFLRQQNTLRDALVAGLTLNIFNNHCDRVKMANLAQLVNVLQSVILTQGEKMVVTPTYHVMEMYRPHQDATRLPAELVCRDYRLAQDRLPALSASASRDASGAITLSLCNLDPKRSGLLQCDLRGASPARVSGRILTARAMNAHNTFDKPHALEPATFNGAKLTGATLQVTLPPKSVVVLRLE